MIPAPAQVGLEELIVNAVLWLRLFVETIGALIIAVGVLAALRHLVMALMRPGHHSFDGIRLTLARYLALALEFQLGADILSTAVSPSWDQIGKLGAIAVIRTALNFFLMREMQQEGHDPVAPPGPEAHSKPEAKPEL